MPENNFNALQESFIKECELIQMKYEYSGYTGEEKWAIISDLTKDEILEKYGQALSEYMPFIVLPLSFKQVRDNFRRNENKHYMRAYRGHFFSTDDEFEEHFPQFAAADCIDDVLLNDQRERLWKGINSLDEKQRGRLIAYFFEGKTYREIGKIEGVDHKAVIRSVEAAL